MKFTQLTVRSAANLGIALAVNGLINSYQGENLSSHYTTIGKSESLAGAVELYQEFPSAQTSNPSVQTAPRVPRSFSSILISQLGTRVDLPLLAKVGAEFARSDRYQTESEIDVQAKSGSTSVTSSAKAVTVVQSPNQFHSEITFAQPKSSTRSGSTVISDGKKVWMYRPDLKQYATLSSDKFMDSDDNYWIGMSSLWFLQIPPEFKKPLAEGALSDPKVQKEIGLADDLPFTGSKQTVNGQELYVYEYSDKNGFAIRTYVEPASAMIKQVVITGKSEGYDVVITERILRRTANPTAPASTFKFFPPRGTKLVKSLSIGPL